MILAAYVHVNLFLFAPKTELLHCGA